MASSTLSKDIGQCSLRSAIIHSVATFVLQALAWRQSWHLVMCLQSRLDPDWHDPCEMGLCGCVYMYMYSSGSGCVYMYMYRLCCTLRGTRWHSRTTTVDVCCTQVQGQRRGQSSQVFLLSYVLMPMDVQCVCIHVCETVVTPTSHPCS